MGAMRKSWSGGSWNGLGGFFGAAVAMLANSKNKRDFFIGD
jgi:hypothetical protein